MSRDPGLILGIDCATSYLALALVNPASGVLAAASEDVGRAHAVMMMDSLATLLTQAGAGKSDVATIGVGIGPGSYTGVRVALATAKGLARAWGVALGGTSSLVALAGSRAAPGEEVVAIIDARRGNVYAQHVRRLAKEPWVLRYEELGAPRKVSREDLATEFVGLRLVEGFPPDAVAIAWGAQADRIAEPYYL